MKHYILFISFLLTFNTLSAQAKFDQDRHASTIYPNPATSSFTIKFDNPSKVVNISVYSIIGNEVLNKKINAYDKDKVTFNVQNLRTGKYIVRILNNDGSTETQSLIKN
ncbi:T9SS type A sorting domain-containing protein [Chishuiella sp.]|uniref:T9SS type A sorting domain-containing protein n=1 Tax=Chishuiella sp. TaxID=1969467 RepID=UPI0028A5D1DA|nr:T9SS type A sorting domain-containing protein [Chishuiella sp.]